MTSLPIHTPNFTRRRRLTIQSMLRDAASNPGWPTLTDDAKVCYAVGLVICDSAGHFTRDQLKSALRDESLVNYARANLAKVE